MVVQTNSFDRHIMNNTRQLFHVNLSLLAVLVVAHPFSPVLGRDAKWRWHEPQAPVSVEIGRSERGIVQNPDVFFDTGRLIVQCSDNAYSSDAVQSNIGYRWFVSEDGGQSWHEQDGAPQDISDHFISFIPTTNFRHPAAYGQLLPDGTRLAIGTYGSETFEDTPEKRAELTKKGYYIFTPEKGNTPGVISIDARVWMSRTRDDGKTWEAPHEIKYNRTLSQFALYSVRGGGEVLPNNTFVQPMWGRLAPGEEPTHDVSLALRTTDGGDTWKVHRIDAADKFEVNETAISRAPNGDLVALMRSTDSEEPDKIRQHDLWQAISSDGGVTWTGFRKSGVLGSCPWLVTTRDGLLVAIAARRHTKPRSGNFKRTGMYACVSRDNGQTWDTEHQVAIFDAGQQIVDGYPKAIALADGTVYTVYGCRGAKVIGGTRFDPRHPDFGSR